MFQRSNSIKHIFIQQVNCAFKIFPSQLKKWLGKNGETWAIQYLDTRKSDKYCVIMCNAFFFTLLTCVSRIVLESCPSVVPSVFSSCSSGWNLCVVLLRMQEVWMMWLLCRRQLKTNSICHKVPMHINNHKHCRVFVPGQWWKETLCFILFTDSFF